MVDRRLERAVRRLGEHLRNDDVDGFKRDLETAASQELLPALRVQKILTRGGPATRIRATHIVGRHVDAYLAEPIAAEYRRYLALSLEIATLRERLHVEIDVEQRRLPKISLRQLVAVAERTFSREIDRVGKLRPPSSQETSVGEHERAIHEFSGYANDVMFAVLRALNEMASAAGGRDLRRPDAIERSIGPFRHVTMLASQLNGLEHVLDSASFGEFSVAAHDEERRIFGLDLADVRRTLIRQLAIRRKLIHVSTGQRHPRFVRERLKEIQGAFLADAVWAYLERAGVRAAGTYDLEALERRGDLLLRHVDAEDDLILVSGRGGARIPTLYHVSMALRWASMAAAFVAEGLAGKARRDFEDAVRLDHVLEGLPREEERHLARAAWEELTIALPARSHFDIVRRPFVRTGPGVAQPIRSADMGTWATVVREAVNNGGEVGRLFGSVWEEFTATSFADTGWEILARNVSIADGGVKLTEVDMLLARNDLLLVVELKALTGSGLAPYDHWKSRMVIEKGCRQALLAADALRDRPNLLASIVGRRVAARINVVQPLVLSSEAMFEGWSHLGVPVAGETIRKAITVGMMVEYYDGRTLEVFRVDHHLRKEDLTTETILQALRDPVELRIAPEQGAVERFPVNVCGATFLIPQLVGDAPS